MTRVPRATYRIQFTPDFGFRAARSVLPYLSELGISHIYASPIFAARRSSTHGYDVIDPNRINRELGSEKELDDLWADVSSKDMGWIQDIVPNHMAFDSRNEMLIDILENGYSSPYFQQFDIDWNHPYESLRGKILAPFLGRFYGECLEDGEIQLGYDRNGFHVTYYDLHFPIRLESYRKILGSTIRILETRIGQNHPEVSRLSSVIDSLEDSKSGDQHPSRREEIAAAKKSLWELYTTHQDIKTLVDEALDKFNGEKGTAESFNRLDELLSEQLFRLSFWKVATEEINYRRFFNINELISVRVEDEPVFRSTHDLTLKFLSQKRLDGVRVDHIDGLYDPATYLERIRAISPESYVVVEKILHPDEDLAMTWPVQGTTGYDFLNAVNGVLCERKSDKRFEKIYSKFTGRHIQFDSLVADRKRLIIGRHMAGDIDRLAHLLKNISSKDRYARDITLYGLKRALVEILALFPVYRTYINTSGVCGKTDRAYIQDAVKKARETNPALVLELNFIQKFLLLEFSDTMSLQEKKDWLHFVMSFQQLTGPLMAKGFEDTALYIYNKLVSLNDVGGSPSRFGISPVEFHYFNKRRATSWPHTMNATSTHDTKRGEDVRARISVLSEMHDEWEKRAKTWSKMNVAKKTMVGAKEIPDANDEYFYYQTLVGAFPFRDDEYQEFVERINTYIIKVVREAKVHTAWLKHDAVYEDGFLSFIKQTLLPSETNHFLNDIRPFQKKVAHYGVFNSLSQTLLKMTCPGVPDFYQGTELWDLSLVDPDNRRPVDFELRMKYIRQITEKETAGVLPLLQELLTTKEDGRIKLYTIYKTLKERKAQKEVFDNGEYLPIKVSGNHRNHVIAFARCNQRRWAIVVAPRRFAPLITHSQFPLNEEVWLDTAIEVPQGAPNRWRNVFSEKMLKSNGRLEIAEVCENFPVALLLAK
jgi:(1->4)-alpha-D-glucan 1-alpha-D-glucosylmutase